LLFFFVASTTAALRLKSFECFSDEASLLLAVAQTTLAFFLPQQPLCFFSRNNHSVSSPETTVACRVVCRTSQHGRRGSSSEETWLD